MPLTYRNFKRYRQTNPGPKTNKAYRVWKGNGGRDYENFHWTEKKQENNKKNKKNEKSEKKFNFNFTFHNYAESKFTLADH